MTVEVGKAVPAFTVPSTEGEFSLASLKGRKLVLYFYPKDNTPGCTNESADFRDHHQDFLKAGAVVAGISRDSMKSHESFRGKLGLPFALLSDVDEKVCEIFNVIRMKNMYGKQVRGIERSTFVIGADGKLLREWRGVKVPGHVADVLAYTQSV